MNSISEKNNQSDFNLLFASITKGTDFGCWGEIVTYEAIKKSHQLGPKIEIKKLLSVLKIKDVLYDESFIKARLSLVPDGFILHISKKELKDKPFETRFVIGHELAHIFFYDIKESPPLNLSYLSHGSKELENACDILSRCILMPKPFLLNELKKFNSYLQKSESPIHNNTFYLISNLCKIFEVHWKGVLVRLMNDLNVLRKTIFFEYSNEQLERGEVWKMQSINISKDLTDEGLFIPYPRKNREKPSAKSIIKICLDEATENFIKSNGKNYFGYKEITVTDISDSELGNLSKHMHDILKLDNKKKIILYYNIKPKGFNNKNLVIDKNKISVLLNFDLN